MADMPNALHLGEGWVSPTKMIVPTENLLKHFPTQRNHVV